MSRSYKHSPAFKVQISFFKKVSSRKNRKNPDLQSGGSYKKNGVSYNIYDQRGFCSSPLLFCGDHPSDEDLMMYEKIYRRK